ncbi:Receptor-interacting serine/threonine-protein kinase 1 [Linnemannia exigua]|uniref:Receptor-interacting serine/threonine-protein kinase 1 n=1 Tax=Linnemannia exigua TaxID=604196 RepID=A0AAD4D1P1_9FUNG|nr:Receptor-interacting serine/threonine-protein kinase 1 [Linnemannia exigua]
MVATASGTNTIASLEGASPPPATLSTPGTSGLSDPEPHLQPIDVVRVGVGILDRLVSNTFSKSFVTKVPQSIANYHVLIKKPMDMWTIEQRLWKTLDVAGAKSGAPASLLVASGVMSAGVSEFYSSLADFERDLRRIFQNATFFNSSTHTIYKEAHAFQNAYLGLLDNYRQGPLYLFRAHTPREMDRKMTDVSTDLFSSLHQPIFDIAAEQIGQLSPERPRFVRMYINKNRSLLAKCGDERFARVAILTDVQLSKPYQGSFGGSSDPPKTVSSPGAPGRNKHSGVQGGPVSIVKMAAKVLIGKPIGERHDMVTVGDLDCPNAWMTVACVRAMEVEVEVPARFEKGVLSKMRHEVVPYSSDSKNTPEHQRVFASALNLLLPGIAKTSQTQGQTPTLVDTPQSTLSTPPSAASTPPATKGLGLGITTPSTAVSEPVSVSPRKRGASSNVTVTIPGASVSKSTWVDLQDDGPKGRYLVKLRLPTVARTTRRRGTSSAGAAMDPPHMVSASTPSTPLISSRVHALSSQVPVTPSSQGSEKETLSAPDRMLLNEQITKRGSKMLQDLKSVARQKKVPYLRWDTIEPTLTVDSAHGLFKRIYHVRGQPALVVQNFKEMDAESFDQRVREVACLLKLRGFHGVGQIQSVIDNEDDHLVGLSMTNYTLKQYATNARRHPTPCQKLCLIKEMISAMCAIHRAGLAHRDLSEVNIMVDEDPQELLEDQSPRPHIKVIDFGKSVFVNPGEVQRWSMRDNVSKEELSLLPLVVLPPDHGYKLYRSILTLPKTKHDHTPLPPVDPRSEDVYSLGVLIWRTFSGKSPWNGAIEDDLKTIRYLVSSDSQIRFQLEKEVVGNMSRELLLKCLTARAETRSTTQQLKDWLNQPEVSNGLLQEFEALGGGRKKVRKNLD